MITQRDAFLQEFCLLAKQDRNIMLVTNDFGAPLLDAFRVELPAQYVPVGIAEQNLVNISAGLALGGKKPYAYSISPYVPMRCLEQIKMQCSFRKLPITFVVVGAGYSYESSGPTHHALADIPALMALPELEIWNISDSILAAWLAKYSHESKSPIYIRMDREVHESVYAGRMQNFVEGMSRCFGQTDKLETAIVTTGVMIHRAIEVARSVGGSIEVFDVYRLKPLNKDVIKYIGNYYEHVIVIEEHFSGPLGHQISQIIRRPVHQFYVPDKYFFEYGGRPGLHKLAGLDVETLTKRVKEIIS